MVMVALPAVEEKYVDHEPWIGHEVRDDEPVDEIARGCEESADAR